MYNFLKAIFGVPPSEQREPRMDNDWLNDFKNEFWEFNNNGNDEDDDDDPFRIHSDASIRRFGLPIFNDPIEVHKYFESLVDEIHKKFGAFSFYNHPIITWDEQQSDSSSAFNENSMKPSSNLRDMYLKTPGYVNDLNVKKEDIDLDGQIKIDDVENVLNNKQGTSNQSNSVVSYSSPKIYSKSVFIRTIKRPDGSVETIKKLRDHTGKEETTITHDNVNHPDVPPQSPAMMPDDDFSAISFLKKVFPF